MRPNLTTNTQTTNKDREALHILLGGIIGLIIIMGIGRFAYTPILPLMQRDLGISNTTAGWIAGLNYIGYLAGAITCSVAPNLIRSRAIAVAALILSITTTIAMGCTVSVFYWGAIRLVAGFISAVLFIIISSEVGEALMRRGYSHWVGTLYGGVGTGIALSGLAIPWLDKVGQWSGAWIGMGIIATILAVIAVALTKGQMVTPLTTSSQDQQKSNIWCIWPLIVAYFFEGLGYIVTATFIVAIVAATPGLENYAPYSWVTVGLAAVPSTIFWPYLSRHFGNKKTLAAAYIIQAFGIFVSMRADTINEIIFVAISFGGTFMGIVALTLAEGYSRLKHDGKRAAAILTASFGIGQILGPILAGFLADWQEGFALPLLLAAIFVMIGAIFTVTDRHFTLKKEH